MTDDGPSEASAQRKQLRLLGVGTALAGLLVLGVDAVSTRPYGVLVYGLGTLGVLALVLERTQGARVGASLGLLTGGIVVWLWPYVGSAELGYPFVGATLALVGLLNVVAAPAALFVRRLGERLGGAREE